MSRGLTLRFHGYLIQGAHNALKMIDIAYVYAPSEFFREKKSLFLIRFSRHPEFKKEVGLGRGGPRVLILERRD